MNLLSSQTRLLLPQNATAICPAAHQKRRPPCFIKSVLIMKSLVAIAHGWWWKRIGYIITFKNIQLVGGWTNPSEKYARQNGFIFPRDRGENFKKKWVATTLTIFDHWQCVSDFAFQTYSSATPQAIRFEKAKIWRQKKVMPTWNVKRPFITGWKVVV